MISIRPATNADLDTLLRFEQGVISAERPFDPTLKPDPINYYDIAYMIDAPEVELLVAESPIPPAPAAELPTTQSPTSMPKSELIGCGYARIETPKHYLRHSLHAYLGFMYVVPSHRGKGVNQLIISALREWAHSKNITELRLDVYHANQPAITAYEKAGFTKHLIEMRSGPIS
ncbi:MAG: GNAT family N-acetyltransferase [Bacteroidetes bacterium]|nr:GNAT family N-acetyltransferase [Bacteroidota bacterium]